MGGPRPQPHNWGSERGEAYGISCSTPWSPPEVRVPMAGSITTTGGPRNLPPWSAAGPLCLGSGGAEELAVTSFVGPEPQDIPLSTLCRPYPPGGTGVATRPCPRTGSSTSDLDGPDTDVRPKIGGSHPLQPQMLAPPPFLVELAPGPRGFGLSLCGGHDRGCGLYICALLEWGPAQHCGCIQVSDQVVEINGVPAQSLTHTQALDWIRWGGPHLRLVLHRGNGLVPTHDHELSPPQPDLTPRA